MATKITGPGPRGKLIMDYLRGVRHAVRSTRAKLVGEAAFNPVSKVKLDRLKATEVKITLLNEILDERVFEPDPINTVGICPDLINDVRDTHCDFETTGNPKTIGDTYNAEAIVDIARACIHEMDRRRPPPNRWALYDYDDISMEHYAFADRDDACEAAVRHDNVIVVGFWDGSRDGH